MATAIKPILRWQRDQLCKELLLLQGHISDPTCPCKTEGEKCVRKHLLTIEALAQETIPIETSDARAEELAQLGTEAQELREEEEKSLCGEKPHYKWPIDTWARNWRKKFETLACELDKGNGNGKAHLKQDGWCRLAATILKPKAKKSRNQRECSSGVRFPAGRAHCQRADLQQPQVTDFHQLATALLRQEPSTQVASMAGHFSVKLKIANPAGLHHPSEAQWQEFSCLVDTGMSFIGLPQEDIKRLNLQSWSKQTMAGIDGDVKKDVYAVMVQYGDRTALTFATPSRMPVIGTLALEAMLLKVDPVHHILEPLPVLAMTGVRCEQGAAPCFHAAQTPQVTISGKCKGKESCTLKVKASESVEAVSSIGGLSKSIEEVLKKIEETHAPPPSAITFAMGSTTLTRYEFQNKLVEASSLLASHDPINFEPTPNYPPELQPRLRGRQANRSQVLNIAKNLDPDALLSDFHSIDRGAPIVGAE